MKRICAVLLLAVITVIASASPISGLLERIDRGASKKFIIEEVKSDTDFFELDQKGSRVVIRGNNSVSIATGLNWYLKYYAGIHLSWNGMTATLPDVLPPVMKKERHETKLPWRYDLNYCTYSYSMAFWDWERWEKEIDWHCTVSIFLWRSPERKQYGIMCFRNWDITRRRSMNSFQDRDSLPGG